MSTVLKDEYFEIVQGLNLWLMEKLEGYDYNKQVIRNTIDGPNYQLTSREKEALVKEMLCRISENTLIYLIFFNLISSTDLSRV